MLCVSRSLSHTRPCFSVRWDTEIPPLHPLHRLFLVFLVFLFAGITSLQVASDRLVGEERCEARTQTGGQQVQLLGLSLHKLFQGGIALVVEEEPTAGRMDDPLVVDAVIGVHLRDGVGAWRGRAEPYQEGTRVLAGEMRFGLPRADVSMEIWLLQSLSYLIMLCC